MYTVKGMLLGFLLPACYSAVGMFTKTTAAKLCLYQNCYTGASTLGDCPSVVRFWTSTGTLPCAATYLDKRSFLC